jgi:hypothetical protein
LPDFRLIGDRLYPALSRDNARSVPDRFAHFRRTASQVTTPDPVIIDPVAESERAALDLLEPLPPVEAKWDCPSSSNRPDKGVTCVIYAEA